MSLLTFTEVNRCRCGYDGKGTHRCHAGRNPLSGTEQCSAEAKPRLVATMSTLAGVQWKTGVAVVCYCENCFSEAFSE